MVAPVKGPFTKRVTRNGPPNSGGAIPLWYVLNRTWYRQARPYTFPLPYQVSIATIKSGTSTETYTYRADYLSSGPNAAKQRTQAYNQAYDRYISNLRAESASLGAALAEYKTSRDMIAQRATALLQGFRAARRGDVRTLKRIFGKDAGVRQNLRSKGGHVLEYSFGWAPLIGDINGAMDTITNGVPPSLVRGSGKAKSSVSSNVIFSSLQMGTRTASFDSENTSVRIQSHVRLDDPNLSLATSLGLTNPVSVAWEVIPFSFVLGYFVNVEEYLNSFSDRFGITELGPQNTTLYVRDQSSSRVATGTWNKNDKPMGQSSSFVTVSRATSIPRPTLQFRPPWQMSMQRAATSVALLLQFLKGK